MLRAVLLIAHELFVMHGLCSDAAAKVERLRLLEQRFAAAQINILTGVVLRDADHVFGQNVGFSASLTDAAKPPFLRKKISVPSAVLCHDRP